MRGPSTAAGAARRSSNRRKSCPSSCEGGVGSSVRSAVEEMGSWRVYVRDRNASQCASVQDMLAEQGLSGWRGKGGRLGRGLGEKSRCLRRVHGIYTLSKGYGTAGCRSTWTKAVLSRGRRGTGLCKSDDAGSLQTCSTNLRRFAQAHQTEPHVRVPNAALSPLLQHQHQHLVCQRRHGPWRTPHEPSQSPLRTHTLWCMSCRRRGCARLARFRFRLQIAE
ncbi:hypothetical protein BKA62DRAFT_488544 [Auriculariales sp. MPI-PUGE-AT-0066]|nr:hypothetical protein BKA62DRAFT_488544 [Auriculariales sp. MPI-PUGE-AT-0066]